MKGRHIITNCHKFYEGDGVWQERRGEMGKPTTCRVVRESLTGDMPLKLGLKNKKEGGLDSLDGGNSRSKGPEVGKNSVCAGTVTFSPQLELL